MKQEHRNGQMTNDDSALSLRPFDSLLFEARLNDEIGLSFNPQPAAQADRRSADLFERHCAINASQPTNRRDSVFHPGVSIADLVASA